MVVQAECGRAYIFWLNYRGFRASKMGLVRNLLSKFRAIDEPRNMRIDSLLLLLLLLLEV